MHVCSLALSPAMSSDEQHVRKLDDNYLVPSADTFKVGQSVGMYWGLTGLPLPSLLL